MKIVYFGSDVFLSCFEYLVEREQVLALYTYHNDEDYFNEYNIVSRAEELGIPVHYEAIEPDTIRRFFLEEGCDLFFIAEYDKKIDIPEDLAEFRGINTHSSLLPQGRSYYPIECAMARELSETGVTMHKLSNHLDSGEIIRQRKVEITEDRDSVDIYLMNAVHARQMLQEIMSDFETAWGLAVPQAEVQEYWRRPEDSLLTVTHDMCVRDVLEIFRKYNSMTEILIRDRIYFVTAVMPGSAPLPKEEMRIHDTLWLYGLKDGHVRVSIFAKNQKNRK